MVLSNYSICGSVYRAMYGSRVLFIILHIRPIKLLDGTMFNLFSKLSKTINSNSKSNSGIELEFIRRSQINFE